MYEGTMYDVQRDYGRKGKEDCPKLGDTKFGYLQNVKIER